MPKLPYKFNEQAVMDKAGTIIYDYLYTGIGLDDKDANKVANNAVVMIIKSLRELNEPR